MDFVGRHTQNLYWGANGAPIHQYEFHQCEQDIGFDKPRQSKIGSVAQLPQPQPVRAWRQGFAVVAPAKKTDCKIVSQKQLSLDLAQKSLPAKLRSQNVWPSRSANTHIISQKRHKPSLVIIEFLQELVWSTVGDHFVLQPEGKFWEIKFL